jgi:hypothetical protein
MKDKLREVLQNPLQDVKIVSNKESLRNCHRLEETKCDDVTKRHPFTQNLPMTEMKRLQQSCK